MNLQGHIMEIITTDWITSRELAEIIAQKYTEEIKKPPYSGKISVLSMALGPSLYALTNQGRIMHDGTKWPGTKKWKRSEKKERISVDDAIKALIELHEANDENQATRMLAARTIKEHKDEFERLIQDAARVSKEASRIGRKMLGLNQE